MRASEHSRWESAIDQAIRGEHVIVMYPRMETARSNFCECRDECFRIGLAHDAKRSNGSLWIIVGDTIRDGCIEFTTFGAERRRWGLEPLAIEHVGHTDWTW